MNKINGDITTFKFILAYAPKHVLTVKVSGDGAGQTVTVVWPFAGVTGLVTAHAAELVMV